MTEAAKAAAKFLKSTLRLPTSTFPARPPPADIAKYLQRCTDDLYAWQRQSRPAANTFRLHDGPPYANGDLHVGHALNKILKDIICRTKLSEGKRVDYVPGWDCHGLPIELKALEHHGWQRGQDRDPLAIRKAARNFAGKAVKQQMKGFKEWGIMADWQNHWKTMDRSFEIRQLEVFQAMVNEGLIYRRHKPVFWSPSSGTALAEAELEYKEDHISTAAYVKFEVAKFDDSGPLYALIWTTTPWTLPANQAIAIHNDLQYVIVRSATHGRLIVAQSRVDALREVIGQELVHERDVETSELLKHTYSGLRAFRPFSENRPLIHADFVSAESGTGLVHCAPGHGMEDYLALSTLIIQGTVSVRAPVDNAGKFDSSATPDKPDLLYGLDVFSDGNAAVLEMLKQADVLVNSATYRHKYPIDWRTKEPVMIRATAQWFADLSPIRQDAISALNSVKFVPDSGQSRLRSFVGNRSEWCISRQRSWGVPIPALYHRETGEAVLTAESVNHVIAVVKDRGSDAWWSDSIDEPAWVPKGLDATDYVRGTDTMDVWFDSGTSWKVMDADQSPPTADVYLEGTDQHRGWFQSSLLTSVAYQKATGKAESNAPFKTLLTHGFTLDSQGKKMSKSIGNVISPDQIIAGFTPAGPPQASAKKRRENHSHGPDALRLWVASTDFTKDVTISETVVKSTHTALDKYRVTFKVLLGMLKGFNPAWVLPFEQLAQLDQIALMRLGGVVWQVQQANASYEFHQAVSRINKWVASDLSGLYLESVKDIIYCDSSNDMRRLSASTTLLHIFNSMQDMLAPTLPLLVEETWEHSSEWFKGQEHPLKRVQSEPAAEWSTDGLQRMYFLITAVNSSVKSAQERARAEKKLGQSLASNVKLFVDRELKVNTISSETWREVLVVSDVEIVESADHHTAATAFIKDTQPEWSETEVIRQEGMQSKVLGTAVVTNPSMEKCARCWRYMAPASAPVKGEDLPLCSRCEDAIQQCYAVPPRKG